MLAQVAPRPTPAERKLWFDLLTAHSEKFTRQKPLGPYVADFLGSLGIVLPQFEAVCARIDEALASRTKI